MKIAYTGTPSELLPEDRFRLYAVCARFPDNLSSQVPWHERQAGVYDCRWGTDDVRVVVAGRLPREPQNAPLHLFSASRELVGFGQGAYRQRSEWTSRVLGQLFEKSRGESFAMPYTIEDFERDYFMEHFPKLTDDKKRELLGSMPPKERREMVQALPPEDRMAGLSPKQIQQYLDKLTASQGPAQRKPRRKK